MGTLGIAWTFIDQAEGQDGCGVHGRLREKERALGRASQ